MRVHWLGYKDYSPSIESESESEFELEEEEITETKIKAIKSPAKKRRRVSDADIPPSPRSHKKVKQESPAQPIITQSTSIHLPTRRSNRNLSAIPIDDDVPPPIPKLPIPASSATPRKTRKSVKPKIKSEPVAKKLIRINSEKFIVKSAESSKVVTKREDVKSISIEADLIIEDTPELIIVQEEIVEVEVVEMGIFGRITRFFGF